VDASAQTLSPDSSRAFRLDTALKNSGGSEGTPSFRLRGLEDEKCNKEALVPNPPIGSMSANAVAIAHFSITDVELPATCYLELVTKGPDGKITNTSLKPIKLSQLYASEDFMWALLVCLGVSVAVTIVARVRVRLKVGRLPKGFKLGEPAWEFAKSWSTTLTLAGATVTAALSLSALPELTQNASKSGYAIIALLIALLVVVAPLSFVIFRCGHVKVDEQTKKESVVYTGGLKAFFLSCTLTLFAGLAQLLVLFLLGNELFRDYRVWSWYPAFHEPWWFGLGSILIVVAAATLCVHTVRSTLLTIQLERANPTMGKLAMVKTRARARANRAFLAEMLTKSVIAGSDETARAAVVNKDIEHAVNDLELANAIDRQFRTSNGHALSKDDEDKLEQLAQRLEVNLQSAESSRPPHSWPVL
jgi:hypothetical protein